MRRALAVLLVNGLLVALAHADLGEMRESLFAAANEARAGAQSRSANVLAPISWAEAERQYDRADRLFDRSGSVEAIRRALGKAIQYFDESSQAADIAASALDAVIQARADAATTNASRYAPSEWESAEEYFGEATRRLEKGSIRAAQRYAEKAEGDYREAELIAIKANYLDETRELIRQAEKLRAERYAPVSLGRAMSLLDQAETELTGNRYDTDRPRSLALDAKHNALHAIYVANLEHGIRKGDTTVEAILLAWEASVGRIGDQLDMPLYFDDGEREAVDALVAAVGQLQRDHESAVQDLNDNAAQVAALNSQVSRMHALLGGGNETIEELERLLARQAEHRARFARVESMFAPEQAVVLRQGDTVIIRMIGLNFDSGAARLKPEHMPLLDSLRQAIAVFPGSHIVVEGHTDAFGSDAANHTLSEVRAEAVVQHLLTMMSISPEELTAEGFGESRPVANNETAEGRKRNRRIDVVIRPGHPSGDVLAHAQG